MNKTIPNAKQEPPTEPTTNTKKEGTTVKIDAPVRIIIDKGKLDWGSIPERIMVILTIALALAAIITVHHFSEQTKSITLQTGFQEQALNRQIIKDSIDRVHQDSVNSALFTAQKIRDSLNNESFIIQNRAYIVFNYDSITVPIIEEGPKISFKWEALNVGKTPAYRIRQGTYVAPEPFTDRAFDTLHASVDTGIVVGAGMSYKKTIDIPADSIITTPRQRIDFLKAFQSGKIPFWIVIIVEYEDIFRRQHWTRCYFQYTKEKTGFMRKYNDTDDQKNKTTKTNSQKARKVTNR